MDKPKKRTRFHIKNSKLMNFLLLPLLLGISVSATSLKPQVIQKIVKTLPKKNSTTKPIQKKTPNQKTLDTNKISPKKNLEYFLDHKKTEQSILEPKLRIDISDIWKSSEEYYCISRDLNKPKECRTCIYSYLMDFKCHIPKRYIKGCLIYNDDETCDTCQNGYYLSMNHKACVPCSIDNCVDCSLIITFPGGVQVYGPDSHRRKLRHLDFPEKQNDMEARISLKNSNSKTALEYFINRYITPLKILREDAGSETDTEPNSSLSPKRETICQACYNNMTPTSDGHSCEPDPQSRDPTQHCLYHDPAIWTCMECEPNYVLNLDGFGNHCVRDDLRKNFCQIEQNSHCLECQNNSYMTEELVCHPRHKRYIVIVLILCLVLLFVFLLVYVLFFTKCCRKRERKGVSEVDSIDSESHEIINIM